MSIELMLNAVNLAFIAFSRQWSQITGHLQVNGQIFVFFVMVVAAAEAAVGLAIIIAALPRSQHSQCRPDRPDEAMTDLHLWLIPLVPSPDFW